MRKSRFSEEQIVGILQEHEAGAELAPWCRRHGISVPLLANTSERAAFFSFFFFSEGLIFRDAPCRRCGRTTRRGAAR